MSLRFRPCRRRGMCASRTLCSVMLSTLPLSLTLTCVARKASMYRTSTGTYPPAGASMLAVHDWFGLHSILTLYTPEYETRGKNSSKTFARVRILLHLPPSLANASKIVNLDNLKQAPLNLISIRNTNSVSKSERPYVEVPTPNSL